MNHCFKTQIQAAVTSFLLLLPATVPAQSWTNTILTAEQRADALLAVMSLEEKIALVHGAGGGYVGNIPGNTRLGIPALNLQDGPAGIGGGAQNVTALPAPIALAASWDVALLRQYGSVLGAEARGKGVHVLLAPMMNIARVYQAGRNFEGYGEDPQLAAAMASAEIQGIQAQGVIATAKHFVANEQETDRTTSSSDVDERVLQEIYYPPFRASVRAGVGAVMASYNRLNTRYACETEALNSTLKKLWGFEGLVMSDWWANFTAVAGADNGLDLEMPSDSRFGAQLQSEIQSGNVPAVELDGMARRVLAAMFRFGVFDNPPAGNLGVNVMSATHNQFARDAAAQGMVLLKNSAGVLPLNPGSVRSIAVLGSAASVAPISTGGGSASVNLPYNVTPLSGITTRAGGGVTVRYNQGDGGNIAQAVQLAQTSDVAIVCVGQQTSEGWDRSSLSLPGDQNALVSAVAAANTNTIVVLYASAPTLMPWASQVAAVLVAWYPGQENGNALAQVLFGDVNPAGKLPVSFPAAGNQVPASTAAQFPGVGGHVAYSEGLQVGYRWFDANNVSPLFAFGHGLSYTAFVYSNLAVSPVSPSGAVQLSVDVANTGLRPGAEVAQLYLGYPAAAGEPPKLLKGFQKINLLPGQAQRAVFNLTWEDLANWDAAARGWRVMPGTFQVMVGASSRDIRLTGSFTVAAPIAPSDLANASLHRPATASSVLSPGDSAAAVVDGNTLSGWTSLPSDPQWIAVDFGITKDLSRLRLQWTTNYARSYALQLSADGTNWTSVYSTTNGSGGIEDVLVSGRGRYVRVLGTQRASAAGYSLLEFEAYCQPQQPFGLEPSRLPAHVEAEDYDAGGQGVAYSDTSVTNQGGVYRSDNVGIQPAAEGGYNVGWIAGGEWLEYTVNVPESAIYSIELRVAATQPGQLRLRLDGTVLATVQIPYTGGYQNWQTVTVPPVPLAGSSNARALRLEFLSGGFNLNWIEFIQMQAFGADNIALNRPAISSSNESGSHLAANAFDGNLLSRWSSQFSDPQWLSVDLGAVRTLARARLNWEAACSRTYTLELSTNGTAWTTARAVTNGAGGTSDFALLGSARYVRLYSTQRLTEWGNSLWEFELYPALPPKLAITQTGANVMLLWPASVAGFNLYSTPSLLPPVTWSPVTNTAVANGSHTTVTVPITGTTRFFRLATP